jgi:hypothetical protein
MVSLNPDFDKENPLLKPKIKSKKNWLFLKKMVVLFQDERFRPSQVINRWRNQGLL